MREINITPPEVIQQKIYFIRGEKVMFDRDLAALYGVETGALNQAVKRNKERFPADFMFQLNKFEMENWISQIVISNREKMGLRRPPVVFTEQGVAMLSSVLNSRRAIQVNIQIIRTFTQLRKILATHKELKDKIEKIKRAMYRIDDKNSKYFGEIFKILRLLMKEDEKPAKRIGFEVGKTKKR